MNFYLLLADGVSKIILADSSGFVLLGQSDASALAIVSTSVVTRSRRG